MKLTVIGHFCVDVFHHADGIEEKRLGGIYHSVAALANLASDRDTIYLVCGAGETDIEELRAALSQYKNIDLSGLYSFPGQSNYVHYYDDSPNERSLTIAPPIPFRHIKRFLNVDGVYINMVSGKDIVVDTMDEIRLEIRGKKTPIHLDIHSLTLHVHEDGTRTFNPMADWRRWCFMTDCVQMNAQEASEISVEHFNDELLAKQMIPLMVQAFIITRGAEGATLYTEQHKQLVTMQLKDDAQLEVVSTLGSGDIFGASLLYAFLKKKNYKEAASFAQRAASHTTEFPLSEKHRELKALRESV
ncbi:MAG: carbohydrate kinase family protein [Bacteriovoracaceae bacterium]|nr:carbohydrate kinase family protein [Bacteroidota bacterium]